MHDHITGNTTFSKTIEITVSPEGQSKIETHGFTGSGCREASRFVEQALGQQTESQLKPEYHAGIVNQIGQRESER